MEQSEHENGMSGSEAGAEWERDLKKYGGAGASLSGNGVVSGLNRQLTIRSNLTI